MASDRKTDNCYCRLHQTQIYAAAIHLEENRGTYSKRVLDSLVKQRGVQVIVCFLCKNKYMCQRKQSVRGISLHDAVFTDSLCVSRTHVKIPDLHVVFSQPPKPAGEALHEATALVVAHGSAPHIAEEKLRAQEQQHGRETSGAHDAGYFFGFS